MAQISPPNTIIAIVNFRDIRGDYSSARESASPLTRVTDNAVKVL
jgi:hypothetical protein